MSNRNVAYLYRLTTTPPPGSPPPLNDPAWQLVPRTKTISEESSTAETGSELYLDGTSSTLATTSEITPISFVVEHLVGNAILASIRSEGEQAGGVLRMWAFRPNPVVGAPVAFTGRALLTERTEFDADATDNYRLTYTLAREGAVVPVALT